MRAQWRGFAFGLATVLLIAALAVAIRLRASPRDGDVVAVDHAIDGDTFALVDGTLVRVIGLDTPETHHPDMDGPEPFGPEAADRASELLEGAAVTLEYDVETHDKYGRTLAHVWLGNRLFAEQMIGEGLATVLTVPPNDRYKDRFSAAEDRARSAGAGLWAGVPTPLPVFGRSP